APETVVRPGARRLTAWTAPGAPTPGRAKQPRRWPLPASLSSCHIRCGIEPVGGRPVSGKVGSKIVARDYPQQAPGALRPPGNRLWFGRAEETALDYNDIEGGK